MMLYASEKAPFHWQDPLLGMTEPTKQITDTPFSAHTTPKHYYEEQENS